MNRYEIALQVLEKLTPELSAELEWQKELPSRAAPRRHPIADDARYFEEYVDSLMPLPERTIVFGRCRDGLPLLMDLADPSSGSILIQSVFEHMARSLLKSILMSAHLISPSHQVNYTLITPQPAVFGNVLVQKHCFRYFHPNDRRAGQHLLEISALVEQRYSGRRRGPALLVSIDGLEAFEKGSLDEETFSHLLWIVREGPGVGVWPIVAANIAGQGSFEEHLIGQFGTMVFDSKRPARRDAANFATEDRLGSPPSFGISIGGELLEFYLPIS